VDGLVLMRDSSRRAGPRSYGGGTRRPTAWRMPARGRPRPNRGTTAACSAGSVRAVDTFDALLYTALATLLLGGALQCIGAWKGLSQHGAGKVGLFHPTIRPWTLASLGSIGVSVLCCVAFLNL
jgi:hypothetical protein